MLIQCTKKLLDQLKIKPAAAKDEQPLFSWHANLITVNHRKAVVLVNDSSRYVITLYGLKAKDFANLDDLITNGIRETFLDECIKEEIVDNYLNFTPEIVYTKTKNRSYVAKMNKACDTVFFYGGILSTDTINQSTVNIKASANSVGDDTLPCDILYRDLKDFAREPIFRSKAFQFKVTLDLENHHVWRRILVPSHITFRQLHNVLQIVFDWEGYHLHDFNIFDGKKSIVNLVCDTEAFEYLGDVPMILETEKRLTDYIPKYSRLQYTYDFGDDWEHYIELEKVIDDYPENYPECLAGEGKTPPEDVGGSSGYDQFLEAYLNPNHPEHQDMVQWAGYRYQDFNIEFVNRRLKNALKDIWHR